MTHDLDMKECVDVGKECVDVGIVVKGYVQ